MIDKIRIQTLLSFRVNDEIIHICNSEDGWYTAAIKDDDSYGISGMMTCQEAQLKYANLIIHETKREGKTQ